MGKSFETRRKLRFGDCDMAGMAYFPAYLNMLNGVNEEMFATIGFPWHELLSARAWSTPTAKLVCDFVKPSLMGDDLDFTLSVARVGATSVTLNHRITCGRELRWTCEQVLVCVGFESHRPQPWPDGVRVRFSDFAV